MHTTESAPAFSYACDTISAKLARGERVLLQDVSFSLSSGQRLAIIGETGSGKTMLALSILGLLPANVRMQSGYIQMGGAARPSGKQLQTLRGDKLVYIPQNGAEFLLPARTVRKQLYDSLKKFSGKITSIIIFALKTVLRKTVIRINLLGHILIKKAVRQQFYLSAACLLYTSPSPRDCS